MNSNVQFLFRGKIFTTEIFVDVLADPCYVFCWIVDEELIKEFGDEITIKTDFEKLLPKEDDYKQLVELRQAIYDVARNTNEFQEAKAKNKVKM